jgi:hypothetical protein
MAHDGMVRTLPKTRPSAPGPSQHNLLLYLIWAIPRVPTSVAFGKVVLWTSPCSYPTYQPH